MPEQLLSLLGTNLVDFLVYGAIALVVLVIALVLWFRLYGRNRRYGKAGSKQYHHHSYRGRRH